MDEFKIYFVDEKYEDRISNQRFLSRLFEGASVEVIGIEPFPLFSGYDALMADSKIRALILDQKMKGGGIGYNGIDLAEYLRGIRPKLPIYILTGVVTETREDCVGVEYRVEDILDKEDLEDPVKSETIKARILRRIEVFSDVLNEREQRFHDLLVKSLKETLSPEEVEELGKLKVARILPIQNVEIQESADVKRALEELRGLLDLEDGGGR